MSDRSLFWAVGKKEKPTVRVVEAVPNCPHHRYHMPRSLSIHFIDGGVFFQSRTRPKIAQRPQTLPHVIAGVGACNSEERMKRNQLSGHKERRKNNTLRADWTQSWVWGRKIPAWSGWCVSMTQLGAHLCSPATLKSVVLWLCPREKRNTTLFIRFDKPAGGERCL